MCAFVTCDRLKETTDVPKHVVVWWSKNLCYSCCRSTEFLCTYWQWYAIVTSSLHTVQACFWQALKTVIVQEVLTACLNRCSFVNC